MCNRVHLTHAFCTHTERSKPIDFPLLNTIPESAIFCPEGNCLLSDLCPLTFPLLLLFFRFLSFMWSQGYQVITH